MSHHSPLPTLEHPKSTTAHAGPDPARERFLIVDASWVSRTRLKRQLEVARPGCELVEASNLTLGLRTAAECRFALIVCDLLLPDGSGFTLIEELRARHPEQAVAVHSSDTQPAIRERVAALGCAAFLEKPLRAGELTAVLEAHAAPARRG